MRISSLPNSSLMILVRLLPDLKDLRSFQIGDYFYTPTIYWGKDGRTVMLLRTTDLLDGSKYEAKKYYLGASHKVALLKSTTVMARRLAWILLPRHISDRTYSRLIPATWGDDGWPVFGDNNQVSASDTYDKLIDLPADLENLVRQRSLVNSDDFDNDAPHQSYQDQDWWTLEEPPQVDDSLIGIELVDNGDFEKNGD